jgi:hypothetical protein
VDVRKMAAAGGLSKLRGAPVHAQSLCGVFTRGGSTITLVDNGDLLSHA